MKLLPTLTKLTKLTARELSRSLLSPACCALQEAQSTQQRHHLIALILLISANKSPSILRLFSQQAHEIQQSSLQDLITKAKGGLESLSRSNTTSRLKDLSTRTQQRVRDGSAFWYGLAKDAYVRGDYTSLLHQTKSSINNVKETTKTSVSEKSRTLFQSSKEKTQEFRSKLGFSRDSGDPNESTKGTYDPFQWLRNAGKTLHRASTSTMREKYLTSKKEAKTDKDGDGTKSDERNSNR
eukprot:gb/GECG01016179.1/.p1 GENE.gb/GECG01016179.1/~~gb/GECG01016179.1/.p1  ORF type:complete len:239 (+),score=32.31 gb/GECG01016179.1/:1-717(+)